MRAGGRPTGNVVRMDYRFENPATVRTRLREVDYLSDEAIAGVVFLALVVGLIRWQKVRQGRYFWERPVAGAEVRP